MDRRFKCASLIRNGWARGPDQAVVSLRSGTELLADCARRAFKFNISTHSLSASPLHFRPAS
eukprot:1015823-Rhodomonas_salina.1